MIDIPILYTFRRCPYAMRARMGLQYAQICVEKREVVLKNKPNEMLELSPKATVPVLLLCDGTVMDESLDILNWALLQNDPTGWLKYSEPSLEDMANLIAENDKAFKTHLDHYKYADRFPEFEQAVYRTRGEAFLCKLEQRLENTDYLFGERISYADIAIMPFIRQFSNVENNWFAEAPYAHLRQWLGRLLEGELFLSIMEKQKPWSAADIKS